MKSAEERLQATGMFQTTAMRSRAFTSGIVRLRLQRIPEKDHKIDHPLRQILAPIC